MEETHIEAQSCMYAVAQMPILDQQSQPMPTKLDEQIMPATTVPTPSQTVNNPIVTTTMTTSTTVTYTISNSVMTTSKKTIFDIPKPKHIQPPNASSTPILENFILTKQGAYNFTAAPNTKPTINQRLEEITTSGNKPNQTKPLDQNSRRSAFDIPKRDVQFGQNPFSQRPVSDSPSMFHNNSLTYFV